MIVLMLASCENFLNAHDTAEQIKEAIEIANSNPITYYIVAEKDSGDVIPASVSKKRKETGQKFESTGANELFLLLKARKSFYFCAK